MQFRISSVKLMAAAVSAVLAAGCASNTGYQKAFSETSALAGNHQTFEVASDQAFRAVKLTLIRQGFTIEHADITTGLIKAARNLQEPSDPNVSYNIITTADVTADGDKSMVTIAASQQTVLHREWHTWWHLLWIIPLFPTGTEYQTVVTKEGNVTDQSFYQDFFQTVGKALPTGAAAYQPPLTKSKLSGMSLDSSLKLFPAAPVASNAAASPEPATAAAEAVSPAPEATAPALDAAAPTESTAPIAPASTP